MQKRKSSALSGSEAKQRQRPAAPTASSGRAACPIAAGGRAANPMTASGPAAVATAPLTAAAAQWDPLLLQYRVIKSCPLGSGADGGVVRGQVRQGPNSGEWHALKYISMDAYHQSRERDTIHLQAAPHPNIVLLISTFDPFPSTRPQWVLAFPEADMDCQAFLARHRRVMTPKIADRMASQILAGIQHLHDICSIVHRDLKPANILVFLEPAAEECTPSASLGAVGGSFAMNARLKIADFSRARFVAPRSDMVKEKLATAVLTMMSTGVCTRNFCAPELLWHGREEPDSEDQVLCDTSIDVWSFGCICFEFHSGQHFASGTTLVEIAAQLHVRLGSWPPQLLPDDVKDEVARGGWQSVGPKFIAVASASVVGSLVVLVADPATCGTRALKVDPYLGSSWFGCIRNAVWKRFPTCSSGCPARPSTRVDRNAISVPDGDAGATVHEHALQVFGKLQPQ